VVPYHSSAGQSFIPALKFLRYNTKLPIDNVIVQLLVGTTHWKSF